MRTTLNPVDFAQGQVLLTRLPDTFSNILQTAQLESRPNGCVAVSYEVAGAGRCLAVASSPNEAIRQALVDLASILTHCTEQQPTAQSFASETAPEVDTEIPSSSERSLSKSRQQTIGTTLPLRLKEHLYEIASSEGTNFAEVSRRYVVFGFEDFVSRSLYTSSTSLFEMLSHELSDWQGSGTGQTMIRLDPGYAVRLRTTAKEYKKSVSELTTLCAAHGLAMQKLLATLETKVSSCKGAAIRNLVSKLGLQTVATPLVSGILVGNIRAPRKLLSKLAGAFETHESLLSTLFRGSFDRRLVPAYKADAGKPVLSTAPATWTSAVKSLNLSTQDAKALLDLGV